MNLAFPAAIVAPAAAAMLLLAGGGHRWRRGVLAVGFGGALAATVAVLVDAVRHGATGARGLEADPWRAGLAVAGIAVAAAAWARPRRDEGDEVGGIVAGAAALATTAAAGGALLATDMATVAGFLVAGTIGVAVASLATRSADGMRAAAWYGIGDLAVVAGLLLAAADGMRVPPALDPLPAGLLLAGAAIRAGVLAPGRIDAWIGGGGAGAALALGPMRATGLMLAGWVALTGGGGAEAMAIGGAIVAAQAARRAARDGSAAAASTAQAAMVFAGLGLGGVAATWGAVLLTAATFAAAALVVLGGARIWSPALGAAPLGAALPGIALIASAALSRGLTGAVDLLVAFLLGLGMVLLAVAGVAGLRDLARPARPLWLLLPGLVSLTVAVVPLMALRGIAGAAAPVLGAGRPLTALPGAIDDDMGIAFAVAALGGMIASLPPAPPARALTDPVHIAEPVSPPLVRALAASAAAAVAGVLWLVWVGIGRGFL